MRSAVSRAAPLEYQHSLMTLAMTRSAWGDEGEGDEETEETRRQRSSEMGDRRVESYS